MATSADGRFVVSASWGATLKVWDLDAALRASVDPDDSETIEPLAMLQAQTALRCCAMTHDGKTILAGDDGGALHVFDWRNGGA